MKSGQLWIVQLAEIISSRVSTIVSDWSSKDKKHPGDQLCRAADSIGSNIVEGYARHHPKDRMRFYSMSRGSIEKTLFFVRRAKDRKLISESMAINLSGSLFQLSKSFTRFIANQKYPITTASGANTQTTETPKIGRTTPEAETPNDGDAEQQ